MRRVIVPVLIATLLAACGQSESPKPAAPAAAPPVAMKANPAAPPAADKAAAATPPPEGDCGDQSAVAADQRIANTARWSTASEQDSFAFDVYRGDAEKGPFVKLTKDAIPGAGTSDETHKYEYRDDSIDPCKEYWYYVESISTKGNREKFTPVFHAPAKRRAKS
ncbi:MAG: hypothetical protein ACREPX_15385 [Rhodanobacteraceae bacterium]